MGLRPFEEIVAYHGPTILRVCRATVGPIDADDAWSETFLAALRAYPGIAEGTNIEAWLVTIAKNKVIDQHRSDARRPLPTDDLLEESFFDSYCDSGGPTWTALLALPMKQREAIAYHHIAGLPYSEVATILGNNEAAARRAPADGLKKLRIQFEGANQ